MSASLAVALLWNCEAKAYQLQAFETSFLGTNSTSAPEVRWSRYRLGNGSASISILSSGLAGKVNGSLLLQRASAGTPSVGSDIYYFTAAIEEYVKPVNPTPEGAIVRLTMTVGCSANAFRTPPPSGNSGNAFINLDTRLGVSSARMIGTSHLDFLNNWSATTNFDSAAVESSFVVENGLIKRLRYAHRRGNTVDPSYYFAVQVNGQANAGTFNSAQAIARATALVNFMMEVSTNNGVSYTVVPWSSLNTNFLKGIPPQLSLNQLNLTNYVGVVGLPLSQHQLQVAPSPIGPWTNFGSTFVLPNLEPFVITDSEPNATRFYQTIKP